MGNARIIELVDSLSKEKTIKQVAYCLEDVAIHRSINAKQDWSVSLIASGLELVNTDVAFKPSGVKGFSEVLKLARKIQEQVPNLDNPDPIEVVKNSGDAMLTLLYQFIHEFQQP